MSQKEIALKGEHEKLNVLITNKKALGETVEPDV
jgi:hypothetical protein